MSENLSKLFTTQFSTNIELMLQQMGSKLRGRVREGVLVPYMVGKQKRFHVSEIRKLKQQKMVQAGA